MAFITGRRAPSDRALTDAWLTDKIKRIHETSRGVYGAPRRRAANGARHLRWSQAGRATDESCRYLRRQATEAVADDDPDPGNHAGHGPGRAAIHARPAQRVVGGRHHVPADGRGWLYLAVVQDTYSRAIVGWSMATHMRATLVVDALQMGLARRRPDPGLIHHSDNGSQYVSGAFGHAAGEAGIAVSMGSRGDAYDNAVAETFFATLKRSSCTAAAGPRGSSCNPRCSSTSRRSITASAATPPSGCAPQSPTNNSDSRRSAVEINRSNNNNQTTNPVSRKTGSGPTRRLQLRANRVSG
jgi:putative transposase